MAKKLYLDRDGIINKQIPYVGTIDRFFWHYEIITLAKYFKKKKYRIIVVTNQSGIERGYYSLFDFYKLSEYMIRFFQMHDVEIEVRACPHLPEKNCFYRKPNIGMIDDARDKEDILIGDKELDMITAKNGNITKRWLISKEPYSKYASCIYKSHKELLLELGIYEDYLHSELLINNQSQKSNLL